MKLCHRLFASVLFLLLSPMSANAIPITFTFDMPAFTTGILSGSTSVLEITANNGGTSALNQAFLNTQITRLSTDLTGPSSNLTYCGSPLDSERVITTDGQGVANLNFTDTGLTCVIADFVFFPNSPPPPFSVSRGLIELWSLPFQYGVQTGDTHSYIGGVQNFPLFSRRTQVSEPGTLALLAAGLGFMYRRKTVGGRV